MERRSVSPTNNCANGSTAKPHSFGKMIPSSLARNMVIQAHASTQPPDRSQPMLSAIHLISREDQRLPEHRFIAIETARRKHSDYPVRLTVKHQIATENAGIARELLLPECVA